jgi:hypothetical protein
VQVVILGPPQSDEFDNTVNHYNKNRHFDSGGNDVALRTLQLGSYSRIHLDPLLSSILDTQAPYLWSHSARRGRDFWVISSAPHSEVQSKSYRVFRPRQ